MTIRKIHAANPDHTGYSGGQGATKKRLWFVQGVAYTDDIDLAIRYTERTGWQAEDVTEIPAHYTRAVTNLESLGLRNRYGQTDAADPDTRWHITAPDGHTVIDIRDVIAGKTIRRDDGRIIWAPAA